MLNRSKILLAAWEAYRAASVPGTPFNRARFALDLACQWAWAKRAAAVATKRRDEVDAKVAAEPVATPRAIEVRDELRVMELSDVPTNWARHHDLTVELFRLSTGEALGNHA